MVHYVCISMGCHYFREKKQQHKALKMNINDLGEQNGHFGVLF